MKPIVSLKVNTDIMRSIIIDKGYSAKQIADKCGLATVTVTRAFAGNGITPTTLKKIADALEISPHDLAAE